MDKVIIEFLECFNDSRRSHSPEMILKAIAYGRYLERNNQEELIVSKKDEKCKKDMS